MYNKKIANNTPKSGSACGNVRMVKFREASNLIEE